MTGKAAQLARSGYVIFVGRGTYEGNITNARTGMAAPQQGLSFVADASGTHTGDGADAITIDGTGTGATLVTTDTDFQRISGLQTSDWTA